MKIILIISLIFILWCAVEPIIAGVLRFRQFQKTGNIGKISNFVWRQYQKSLPHFQLRFHFADFQFRSMYHFGKVGEDIWSVPCQHCDRFIDGPGREIQFECTGE